MTEESERGILYVIALVIGVAAIELQLGTGYVVDSTDGTPLADVYIVSRWEAEQYQGIRSQHVCFKTDAAVTNAVGRYTLLPTSMNFNPLLSGRSQTTVFYKAGYQGAVISDQTSRWRVELSPDSRKDNDRLDHVYGLSILAHCGHPERQRIALPFHEAILSELGSLIPSPDVQRGIANTRFWISLVEGRNTTALQN